MLALSDWKVNKTVIIGTILLGSAVAATLLLKNRLGKLLARGSSSKVPIQALPTYKITRLFVYPIKSCFGMEVYSSDLIETGLEFDRRWVFVNSENKVLTIRDIAEMTLLIPRIEEDSLVISIRGTDVSVRVPLRPTMQELNSMELVESSVWGSKVDGYAYPSHINDPFSKFFGTPVRLLYKGPYKRVLVANGSEKYLGYEGSTDFADFMPVLVANEASMKELNSRLDNQITIERFRPNIIVAGSQPWEEDRWRTLKISDRAEPASEITLDVACRAARCLVPNVNPWTAEKDKNQPWDTLMSYRRIDEGLKFKPCFGMFGVPHEGKGGSVKVGDDITVLDTRDDHKLME